MLVGRRLSHGNDDSGELAGSTALTHGLGYRLEDCRVALGRSSFWASASISGKWARCSCCEEGTLDAHQLEFWALVYTLTSLCWVLCSIIYKVTELSMEACT